MRDTDAQSMVPVDALVRRFNEINRNVSMLVPAFAIAYDTIERVLPLLREMQSLLSQRPHGLPCEDYKMLQRKGRRIVGARVVERRDDLPTWTLWLAQFAVEVGYSVRHLRRLILSEPRRRTRKGCGWSRLDHERLLEIAAKSRELIRAIASGEGGEIYRIAAELHRQLDAAPDENWEVDIPLPRHKPARKATDVVA